MIYAQPIDSARIFGLLTTSAVVRTKTARTSVCTADPSLNINALQERTMSLIPSTPGIYSAQATSPIDYIAQRDQMLRREAERGSEMLLRAMIRELESMGVLA